MSFPYCRGAGGCLPFRHVVIAILVMGVWGSNFVSISIALKEIAPLTLGAIRFILTAFPAVLFIPRPKVNIGLLIAYGFTTFGLQFALLFTGMQLGVSPGLTSMILQVQVFFTIALSAVFFGERPNLIKVIGALIGFSGVALVGMHSQSDVNILGLILILGAAFSWASGNLLAKRLSGARALAMVVWGALMASPFLTAFAFYQEGLPSIEMLSGISGGTWRAIAYTVLFSTLLSYSLWSWLLQHHSASTVAPFSLLVPVFGMLSSAWYLGEEMPDWKIKAAILVIVGLTVNLYGSRRRSPF